MLIPPLTCGKIKYLPNDSQTSIHRRRFNTLLSPGFDEGPQGPVMNLAQLDITNKRIQRSQILGITRDTFLMRMLIQIVRRGLPEYLLL